MNRINIIFYSFMGILLSIVILVQIIYLCQGYNRDWDIRKYDNSLWGKFNKKQILYREKEDIRKAKSRKLLKDNCK